MSMKQTYKIAVYPGDGIGPEVIVQTVRVLERVQELDGTFKLDCTWLPWGGDYYRQHGRVMPENYLSVVREFDAILLGAVGDPERIPDHITLEPLVGIRQGFDQYACVRPCRLFRGVPSALAKPGAIDLIVLRENAEGEYVRCGGRIRQGQAEEVALQAAIHTRRGVERILRFGFELALKRRKRLTLITKSNALKFSMVMWDDILAEVQKEFPQVAVDRQHADAAAMNLVRRPETFDVMVASNLFGDLLSDLAGAITGGLGLAPSANINPQRTFPSLFEPVHGSAPDIAGKGIANPTAAILSAAMMLEWLNCTAAANRIRTAVEATLASGEGTPDLGGKLNTAQMAEKIMGAL